MRGAPVQCRRALLFRGGSNARRHLPGTTVGKCTPVRRRSKPLSAFVRSRSGLSEAGRLHSCDSRSSTRRRVIVDTSRNLSWSGEPELLNDLFGRKAERPEVADSVEKLVAPVFSW